MCYQPFTLLSLVILASSQVRAAAQENAVELISGNNLVGWEMVAATPEDLGSVVKTGADGVLAITGKPVGYIATKASYKNYKLHFEWRWPAAV